MKSVRHSALWPRVLTGALATAIVSAALASSHREAPFITTRPKVDGTDFYMFNSYEAGRTGFVTLIDGPSSDLNLMVSQERAEAHTRLLRPAAPEIIHTAGWEETLICCVTGAVQIEDAAGHIATLSGADVARCTPEDGVLTCAPDGVAPTLLFVAALRHPGNSGRKPIL